MNNTNKIAPYYHKLGHGPKTLLAFHGIGQDGKSCFNSFAENLGARYTIYAFDLFFHGKSNRLIETDWVSKKPVSKETWTKIISEFLDMEQIFRFDVAGFSMGGRFALATLESFPNQIGKAFLIAPDGVSEHPVYTFASRFPPARRTFRWCMQHPETFFKAASVFEKTGLVHSNLYRFTQHALNTPEKRQSVYNSWVAFRELRFNIPHLHKILMAHQIDIYLFTGKYDKLLPASAVKNLARLLPPSRNFVLRAGHGQLVEQASLFLRDHVS